MSKYCPKCECDQPDSAFSPDASHSDGLTTYCKKHRAEAKRQRRIQNPDQARARDKADYQSMKGRAAALQPQESLDPETTPKWCSGCKTSKLLKDFSLHCASLDGRQSICKECSAQTRAEKRETDEEYRLSENARCRTWYHANLEQEHQRARDYKQEHPEEVRATNAAWRATHPEAIRVYASRRRAREAGLPDTLTPEDVAFLYQYWHFACAICDREEGLFGLELVLDHWIPIVDPACPGTVPDNMVLLCHGTGGCNNSKHGAAPLTWLTRRYGARKARQIVRRVETYFQVVRARQGEAVAD